MPVVAVVGVIDPAMRSGMGEVVKVAVTLLFAVINTVQVPVPEQPPPLHPANVEPALGVAVSVTEVL